MSGPPAAVSHAELRFYREERPRVAALFSDRADQDRELKHRWEFVSQHVIKIPSVSVATDDDDVSKVRLSQPMTDAEAAEYELQLFDIEMTSDNAIFVYTQKQPCAASSSAAAAPPSSDKGKAKTVSLASVEDSKLRVGQKRRDAASSAFAELLSRFRKDTLQNMCEDLDIKVSGNRQELIARIAAKM